MLYDNNFILFLSVTARSESYRAAQHAHIYIPWSLCIPVQGHRPRFTVYMYAGTWAMDSKTTFSLSGRQLPQVFGLDSL